jgi:MoaA/NifB/PqqE/SkfB family radical SAM enzyme
MVTHVKNNFCIAPFSQVTLAPNGGYSPCPEIGGQPWWSLGASLIKIWPSEEFEKLRTSFINNEKSPTCSRCWDQESYNKISLRKTLLTNGLNGKKSFQSGELIPFLEGGYKKGPKQLNLMVGNLCNLKCRICHAASSSTWTTEGKFYEQKFKIKTNYTTLQEKPITFNDQQIDSIIAMSSELERIEFYGGEPLLDRPSLRLLEHLKTTGQSKKITLFYNTNGTVTPTEKHLELWPHFASVEFNFSIDDIDHRYTYNRHPARWENLESNIKFIQSQPNGINAKCFAICTVSTLNVFYLPEILDRLDQLKLPYHLNDVRWPEYYNVLHLPQSLKTIIVDKLQIYKNLGKVQFLLNMLHAKENLKHWEKFKFWTREKDSYRSESFKTTYPEFYNAIKQCNLEFV